MYIYKNLIKKVILEYEARIKKGFISAAVTNGIKVGSIAGFWEYF